MLDFTAGSRLAITNTGFQHPRCRWASSVHDCRPYWGADTGSANESDNALVRATVRICLKACQQSPRPFVIEVPKLKIAARVAFSIELRDRFSVLESTLQSVELEWDGFRSEISVSQTSA